MAQYLIYFMPLLIVSFGVMLAPFISDNWPDWLYRFVSFCAEIANGVWVAGVAMVILTSVIGVPLPLAVIVSWPIMYFSGRYFARFFERLEEMDHEMRRRAWENHHNREEVQEDRRDEA